MWVYVSILVNYQLRYSSAIQLNQSKNYYSLSIDMNLRTLVWYSDKVLSFSSSSLIKILETVGFGFFFSDIL